MEVQEVQLVHLMVVEVVQVVVEGELQLVKLEISLQLGYLVTVVPLEDQPDRKLELLEVP
jgi:hypothetical protein